MNAGLIRISIIGVIFTVFYIFIFAMLLYLAVLVVRALKKYIGSKQETEKAPAQSLPLAEALKQRRTEKGLTQEQLAEHLGVSRQAVSKWEQGLSEPSTANLLALARLYGISVDALLQAEQ